MQSQLINFFNSTLHAHQPGSCVCPFQHVPLFYYRVWCKLGQLGSVPSFSSLSAEQESVAMETKKSCRPWMATLIPKHHLSECFRRLCAFFSSSPPESHVRPWGERGGIVNESLPWKGFSLCGFTILWQKVMNFSLGLWGCHSALLSSIVSHIQWDYFGWNSYKISESQIHLIAE